MLGVRLACKGVRQRRHSDSHLRVPQGKLNGLAVRVPLTNSSITDCVFEVGRPTTVEEVNALLKVRNNPPAPPLVRLPHTPTP